VRDNRTRPTCACAIALSNRISRKKAGVALANKTARRLWPAGHHR
jgi:hypothetical protein